MEITSEILARKILSGNRKMEIELIDLPQVCLEEIFKKLKFAEISRLGATCKYFREIAKTIFRLYFKNLEETIEAEMEKIETEANKPESLSISDHLHLALLHSVLRILLSEAKMLKAHCWRYMREPSYDFCFPAGLILDEFEKILRNVRNKTLKKDMEPEITTSLFHLGETFYDYFDYKIENYFPVSSGMEVKITSESNRQTFLPHIYNFVSKMTKDTLLKDIHRYMKKHQAEQMGASIFEQETSNEIPDSEMKDKFSEYGEMSLNEKTLFGVKILDILNCCASSDFHTLLLHNYENDGFKLKSHYELRDINVLEALPTIGLFPATSEKQLNKICRYIRNNVRWTNLFHPLQDLWMLEDAIEINRNVDTASALLKQWKLQRTSSRLTLDNTENDVFQYDYRKILSRFKNRFGLLVTASLECPTLNNVPLKIQNYLKTKYSSINNFQNIPECNPECDLSYNLNNKNIVHQVDMEKWNCSISTYKFHFELKIQYPSFLSETVKEAILKVDQIGEKTIVTTHGDDIRKSATYRVDDENDECM